MNELTEAINAHNAHKSTCPACTATTRCLEAVTLLERITYLADHQPRPRR